MPKGWGRLPQRPEPYSPLGTLGFEGPPRDWGTLVNILSLFLCPWDVQNLGSLNSGRGLLKINPRLEVQQALWG